MHTVDGGALYYTIKLLFSVGLDDERKYVCGKLPAFLLKRIDNALDQWARNTPIEFSRRPRPMSKIRLWKMRETAMVGLYIIPALLHLRHVKEYLDASLFNCYMHLIAGMRLVCGYDSGPVPVV